MLVPPQSKFLATAPQLALIVIITIFIKQILSIKVAELALRQWTTRQRVTAGRRWSTPAELRRARGTPSGHGMAGGTTETWTKWGGRGALMGQAPHELFPVHRQSLRRLRLVVVSLHQISVLLRQQSAMHTCIILLITNVLINTIKCWRLPHCRIFRYSIVHKNKTLHNWR